MVLTERQRKDLHSGIYEYLLSQEGESWQAAATAFQVASATPKDQKPVPTPLLEKKWTAIPRLQKKVLELERASAQHQKIHAHRTGVTDATGGTRRMLPRLPCAHTLQGHAGVVTTLQVHPVFTLVVSGSEDGTVKVWDHESGEYVRTLKGHTNTVTSLAFTPTGTHLASSSTDLSIKLWDFTTYNCIRTLRGHDHTISAVAFLPLLSQTNAVSATIAPQTGMDSESAGAQFVVSCGRDKMVKVWDVETGFCEQTISDHTDWVRCISVRRSDGAFCTAGNDSVIYVYNGRDRSKLCELRGHESVIESVAFICETQEASQKTLKASDETRDLLASGGRDRSVRLWKISTVSCLATFMAHDNWVRTVQLHPSGNFIISAGDDRTIRVLDIKAQRCLRTLDGAHSHFVSCLSMHPTLPILVSGSVDTTLKCWMLD